MNQYFLTCPRGLEEITSNQISKYIKDTPVIDKGGVSFKGDNLDMYMVNLHSRTGMHLLKKVLSFKINSIKELYSKIYDYSWDEIITSDKSFVIKTKTKSEIFNNSSFITLKVKDAIVDHIRSKTSSRPSIDKLNPDIRLFVIIHDNEVKIYVDSTGDPLFKRGYRSVVHKAALNESLAAGLIYLSNWDRKSPFYDIMCGSGTIPIEAAMMAYNIPSGVFRGQFAFQKWDDYDHTLWISLICKAKDNIKIDYDIKINGSDFFQKNIDLAINSSKKMGIKNLYFDPLDIKDFKPFHDSGTIIINPPYGNRLGDQLVINKLYKQLGDLFKTECQGFDVYMFTGNLEAIKSVGLRSKKRIILRNGKIDCRLLYYPITTGKFT